MTRAHYFIKELNTQWALGICMEPTDIVQKIQQFDIVDRAHLVIWATFCTPRRDQRLTMLENAGYTFVARKNLYK